MRTINFICEYINIIVIERHRFCSFRLIQTLQFREQGRFATIIGTFNSILVTDNIIDIFVIQRYFFAL